MLYFTPSQAQTLQNEIAPEILAKIEYQVLDHWVEGNVLPESFSMLVDILKHASQQDRLMDTMQHLLRTTHELMSHVRSINRSDARAEDKIRALSDILVDLDPLNEISRLSFAFQQDCLDALNDTLSGIMLCKIDMISGLLASCRFMASRPQAEAHGNSLVHSSDALPAILAAHDPITMDDTASEALVNEGEEFDAAYAAYIADRNQQALTSPPASPDYYSYGDPANPRNPRSWGSFFTLPPATDDVDIRVEQPHVNYSADRSSPPR
jgi:hypothetical protein